MYYVFAKSEQKGGWVNVLTCITLNNSYTMKLKVDVIAK